MQTVVLWAGYEASKWILVDGDAREFEGCFVNANEDRIFDRKMNDFFYTDDGDFRWPTIMREKAEELVRNGAFLVSCGFAL